jgi:DNA modification methylase
MKPYYEQSGITIYHAPAHRVLPLLEPCDLLLTDPPYGLGEAGEKRLSRTRLAKVGKYRTADWDDTMPPTWLIEQARGLCRWQIIFGGNYFVLPPSRAWLVWDKENTGDFADCELAWTNLEQAVRRIRYRWNGMIQEQQSKALAEKRVHPTQKPEAVMRWALLQAPSHDTILDPFMGSGTTLVAAKRLGKRAIGIEREEEFCEAAIQRLAQEALPLEVA